MILITGSAGYIGSHCTLKFLEKGFDVVCFDNLSTGHIETIEKLRSFKDFEFIKGDLTRKEDIDAVFKRFKISAVIHFAALSQVAQSTKDPKKYYLNNVFGTLNLLNSMVEYGVKKIVFSSTAAVYGEPEYTPIDENHPKCPINPYGKTKLMIENIMDDYDAAYNLKSVRLRYFNVIGADKKGRIGEWHDPETHLVPNVLNSKNDAVFKMYGTDYPTPDGTCIRDYIDVLDLADAHLLALQYLEKYARTDVFNLGTQKGVSVREIFSACEVVLNQKIPLEICSRREGDPAILVADNKKALDILGWMPRTALPDSIQNANNWHKHLKV